MRGNRDQNNDRKHENTYQESFLNDLAGFRSNSNGAASSEAHPDRTEMSLALGCVAREWQAFKAEKRRACYLALGIGIVIAGTLLFRLYPVASVTGAASRMPIFVLAYFLLRQSVRANEDAKSFHDKAALVLQTYTQYLIYKEKKDDKAMLAFAKGLTDSKEIARLERPRKFFGRKLRNKDKDSDEGALPLQ